MRKFQDFVLILLSKSEDGILLYLRSIEPYEGKWHIPGGQYIKEKD